MKIDILNTNEKEFLSFKGFFNYCFTKSLKCEFIKEYDYKPNFNPIGRNLKIAGDFNRFKDKNYKDIDNIRKDRFIKMGGIL